MFGIMGWQCCNCYFSIDNFSNDFLCITILTDWWSMGAIIAFKIPMTAMPELVAGFHSLEGLAAVFVAISAFISPEVFNLGTSGNIKLASLIEMSIGQQSEQLLFRLIIAFLKLRGLMSGSPITFPGQHILNLLILILL